MKTSRVFLAMAAFGCMSVGSSAQILNSDFELLREDGSIANWVATYSISVPMDSTEACPTDSILFRTTDAYSGDYALVLQNVQCNESVIYGNVSASDDIPAWSPTVPFTERPVAFSLFYKFFPEGGDGIRVRISLKDGEDVPVAEIDTNIYPGVTGSFNKLIVPINYMSSSMPVRMYMYYSIIDKSGTTLNARPGSKLIIDNIATETTLSIADRNEGSSKPEIAFYPTKAVNELFIAKDKGREAATIEVFDMSGRRLMTQQLLLEAGSPSTLDISNLPAGNFIIRAISSGGVISGRFIH